MHATSVMPETRFGEIFDQIRNSVAGIRAIVVLGADGGVPAHFAAAPDFEVEAFASEYVMLLRIASRTSEDVSSGKLNEHIAISERTLTIARRFDGNSFLIVISDSHDQVGRARYEIRRAALFLDQHPA